MSDIHATLAWRPVRGYEGLYEVSERGHVRRIGKATGARVGRILSTHRINSGYLTVQLWSDNNGVRHLVHRVVADSFLGPIQSGMEVNHRNGEKLHNWAENLEIVTSKANTRHAMNLGLQKLNGEDNPAAKLTADQVAAIRSEYRPGVLGYVKLGAKYGVTPSAIRNIIKGRRWAA